MNRTKQDWRDLETHVRASAAVDLSSASDDEIAEALAQMVSHPEYPCLGAKSVFRREAATIAVLPDMNQEETIGDLAARLELFGEQSASSEDFVSFIAVFRAPDAPDERTFEHLLWSVLQRLHDDDEHPWAESVSPDPDAPQFAFSHAGTAYFIVGLHPQASRIARRSPLPTLVFNRHEQFEKLRQGGLFDRMRTAIRRRDTRVQGSVNPMASDHGETSEARQYSGRAVEQAWQAPFSPKDSAV